MVMARAPLALCIASATLLTACGSAEVPKIAAPPAEKGVFVSSSDCTEAGKISEDACGKAIDQAVAIYSQTATMHNSLRLCEVAEGPERCVKAGENQYRVRVQAFLVTMGNPPTAVPLYPPPTPTAAFRSPSKQDLNVNDESLNMSHQAMAVASENARLPRR